MADPVSNSPPPKLKNRLGMFVAVFVSLVVFIYVLSYVVFRTRGIRQMNEYDNVGILYTDVEATFKQKDLSTHWLLEVIFAPANEIDCYFFDGERPISCILF